MSTPGERPAKPPLTPPTPPQPPSPPFSDPLATPPGGPANLHAPWRLEYLEAIGEQEKRPSQPGPPTSAPSAASPSFLHDYWLDPAGDTKNHIIRSEEHTSELQ